MKPLKQDSRIGRDWLSSAPSVTALTNKNALLTITRSTNAASPSIALFVDRFMQRNLHFATTFSVFTK